MRSLPDGHTVKYTHSRDTKVLDDERVLSERGGATVATVFNETGEIVATGVALCRSDELDKNGRLVPGDAFNRKLGRVISLGRALKVLETGVNNVHGWGPGGFPE